MKTNNNSIKRLGALILAGSIATIGAFAADTTAPKPATAAETPAAKDQTAAKEQSAEIVAKKEQPAAKEHKAWFGGFVENSTLPAKREHQRAPDVQLTKVYRGSPAYIAGLRAGDVIWKFEGERLKDTEQFKRDLREQKPGNTVRLEILRNGKREEMKVTLGTMPIASAHHKAGGARLHG